MDEVSHCDNFVNIFTQLYLVCFDLCCSAKVGWFCLGSEKWRILIYANFKCAMSMYFKYGIGESLTLFARMYTVTSDKHHLKSVCHTQLEMEPHTEIKEGVPWLARAAH